MSTDILYRHLWNDPLAYALHLDMVREARENVTTATGSADAVLVTNVIEDLLKSYYVDLLDDVVTVYDPNREDNDYRQKLVVDMIHHFVELIDWRDIAARLAASYDEAEHVDDHAA